jgi:hypothetical protein
MQNRYVGDIGDFGKYALLRHLCGWNKCQSIRLAVVWCLFPDETFNNDGKHITYLRDSEFAKLDPELHSALNSIVSLGLRNISNIAEFGCLPPSTVFFTQPVWVPEDTRAGPTERIRHRDAWLHECLRQTQSCELVFFDPDNGLEIPSVPKHHPRAGKYIYWDELVPFWERGDTLLIYHHLNRTAPAARQVQSLKLTFTTAFDGAAVVVPLVFRRGSSRVFWLLHHGDALGRGLELRAANLLCAGWSQHFRPFGWPSNDQASTRAS